ncbi:MAG: HTH-type sugar sensing transcriptional regulator TrmB [Haloferacaceae archaeon]
MSDDLRRTLERVGERFDLGEYEIETYLAVLEYGQLTASEIAERTEVPQPRVYDTARSLADRGLVELRESRPMKVVAIDPDEAFDDIRDALTEMVSDLESRYTAPSRETEAASLVKSRSTILRYMDDVVEAADYELTLSLTPELVDRYRDRLAEAVADDVSVELLVSPAAEAPDPETFDYSAIATEARMRRGITTPVLAVADGEYSVYATQDALRGDRERYGVIFNRSALGFLVSAFFETVLWTTADALFAPEYDRSYPRTYASVRRAVKDLRGRNGTFHARVEGREVTTGDAAVVAGPVVDVEFDPSGEVATLVVDADDGPVTVGGRVAAYEDIEAHEIRVDTDPVGETD